jgi:hypothetical protein
MNLKKLEIMNLKKVGMAKGQSLSPKEVSNTVLTPITPTPFTTYYSKLSLTVPINSLKYNKSMPLKTIITAISTQNSEDVC